MIRVCIGSHKRFERCEPVIRWSIIKHASEPVEIIFLRPEYFGYPDSGCTGFSKMRYCVPNICNFSGSAIYLDVDMILMSDIAELWINHAVDDVDFWHCMIDGSDEVSVINCENTQYIRHFPRDPLSNIPDNYPSIPKEWNCEDWNHKNWKLEDAKLIHFTDLKRQPWSCDNPHSKELAKIWFELESEAKFKANRYMM